MSISWYEKDADKKDHFLFVKRCLSENRPLRPLPHIHSSVEFVFGLRGTSFAYINEKKYEINENTILFINHFERHRYEYVAGTECFVVVISSSFFDSNNNLNLLSFPTEMKYSDGKSKIKEFLEFSNKTFDKDSTVFKIGFVNMLISLMMNEFPYKTDIDSVKTNEVFVGIMKYMSEHFKENLSITQVAKKFGYSPNYLSMLFNKYMGMRFKEHLNRCRMAEFIMLRRIHPELSICKAAELSGFNSLSSFYYTLNKIKKESPHFDIDLR